MLKDYQTGWIPAVRTSVETHTYYLHADHLGSTSLTTDESGMVVSELRYSAYGEERFSSGDTPTNYRYTGQLSQATMGLYFYGARWYDPSISHFVQADTIVPGTGNPLAWDRYAYSRWNPARYVDPSGHSPCDITGADPECNDPQVRYWANLTERKNSSETLRPIIEQPEEMGDDLPFDTTLGGNSTNSGSEIDVQNERPSVAALIALGIPLTIAIFISELGLSAGEIALAMTALLQPELVPVILPLEFVLVGTSFALGDLEIAYLSYTYRVINTPLHEPVKFELLPPWGLRNE